VEFEGAPVARISRARAHRSSGRSGPISRSANA
jgi:hypothetical protein